MNEETSKNIIEGIFEDAHNQDGLNFLYILFRIEGIELDGSDRLLKLRLKLQQENVLSDKEFQTSFAALLIENLII